MRNIGRKWHNFYLFPSPRDIRKAAINLLLSSTSFPDIIQIHPCRIPALNAEYSVNPISSLKPMLPDVTWCPPVNTTSTGVHSGIVGRVFRLWKWLVISYWGRVSRTVLLSETSLYRICRRQMCACFGSRLRLCWLLVFSWQECQNMLIVWS